MLSRPNQIVPLHRPCSSYLGEVSSLSLRRLTREKAEDDVGSWAAFDVLEEGFHRPGHTPPEQDLDKRVRTMFQRWATDASHPCISPASELMQIRERLGDHEHISEKEFRTMQGVYERHRETCGTHLLHHGDGETFKGAIDVIIATPDSYHTTLVRESIQTKTSYCRRCDINEAPEPCTSDPCLRGQLLSRSLLMPILMGKNFSWLRATSTSLDLSWLHLRKID